jgi:phosphoglycolate phosphatase-like HAD superfamily hydrolase
MQSGSSDPIPQETSHTPAMLFVLNGTLIDSVDQHVLASHEALEELGFALGVWRIHRPIGMSGGLLVQALGSSRLVDSPR